MSTVRMLPMTAPVAAGWVVAGNGVGILAVVVIALLTLLALREVRRHLDRPDSGRPDS
ncbi:MAG TPA: hypothetical protein VF163_06920 [Micromonosporaceae bacterium]